MAGYSIFSDVTNHLVKLLRDGLCPEPIITPLSIDAVNPADQNADYTLGVYLYDIKESGEMSSQGKVAINENEKRFPPKVYTLHYLICVNQNSQTGMKQPDIQKILGRTAQVLGDNAVIDPTQINYVQAEGDAPINIQAAKMDFEQKQRVWTALNKPYALALYYTVYPASIYSERIVYAPRVRVAAFDIRKTGE